MDQFRVQDSGLTASFQGSFRLPFRVLRSVL